MNATQPSEFVSDLAERYDGTPFEAEGAVYWVSAGITKNEFESEDYDADSTAAAWEESMIDSVIETFNENDWEAIGKRDAGGLSNQELAETGYENPNCSGTPWSDGTPKEAKSMVAVLDDLISTEVHDKIEAAISEATDDYNGGYIEAVTDAIEEIATERAAHIARADAAGWRICVFGLPGSSTHVARVAAPGEANDVSGEIFNPGPCGPCDFAILTPSQADNCNWRDGNPIYLDEVDSILSDVE